MNSITTKEFIESLNFEYFRTYSFQRKGGFSAYETLFNKYLKDNESLTKEETAELRKLRKSDLFTQKNNFIFTNNGEINGTAELIYSFDKLTGLGDELIKILKTPFVDYDVWMCSPIYRDAILFYDTDDQLIGGINICFECCNMINLNKEEVLADRIVYEKLKVFLQSLGHKIN